MKNTNLLKTILITVIIIALTIISFGGIYVNYKNTVKNILPDYILGKDLKGYRQVELEVVAEEKNEEENNENQDNTEEETKTQEELENEEKIKKENYKKSKDILVKRLDEFGIKEYVIRQDESTGKITIELPEDETIVEAINELSYQGIFELVDADTNEVLMTNDDIKSAVAGYTLDNSSYTIVAMGIYFNKEGTEKLKNITNTYTKTTVVKEKSADEQSEGENETESNTEPETEEVTKNVIFKVDGQEILKTYFSSEISDGAIQLTFGSNENLSTDELKEHYDGARNMAILLNNGKMPVEYSNEKSIHVETDITENQISMIIYVILAVVALSLIYLMIKFKKIGAKGVIAIIGYISILLIAIRLFNVEITLAGIFAIALSIILEMYLIFATLKENKKENNIEKALTKTKYKNYIILIPAVIISIVFTMLGFSYGTALFWGIFINVIYNLSISKLLLVDEK